MLRISKIVPDIPKDTHKYKVFINKNTKVYDSKPLLICSKSEAESYDLIHIGYDITGQSHRCRTTTISIDSINYQLADWNAVYVFDDDSNRAEITAFTIYFNNNNLYIGRTIPWYPSITQMMSAETYVFYIAMSK